MEKLVGHTGTKRVEEELGKSEEKYRSLMNNVRLGVFRSTPGYNGRFLEANPAMEEVTGYSREELLQIDVSSLYVVPEERTAVLEKMAAANGRATMELNFKKKDGTEIIVSDTKVPVRDGTDKIIYFDGILEDITERKQIEETLRKFKTISDNASYGITIVDLEGNVCYVNESFAQMHGYIPDEVIGKHLSVFHTEQQMSNVNRLIEKLNREGSFAAEELGHRRKDNTEFTTLMNGTFVKDENGNTLFLAGTAVDITERKKMEEALRESEEELRRMFDSVSDGIAVSDLNGIISKVNEGLVRMLGMNSKDELLGKDHFELIPQHYHREVRARMEEGLKVGNLSQMRNNIVRADGSEFPAEISASVLKDTSNNPIGFITIIRDITERKNWEQLQRNEKHVLTLLGQGAELNELLDAILRFGEYNDPSIKGSVLLFDRSRECLVHASAPSLPEDFNELLKYGLPIGSNVGSCGTAAYLRERVIVTDIENSPLFKPYKEAVERALSNGLLSCWSQPIIASNGDLLGTIANYSNKVGEPSADNLRVLEWSARIAAIAIERKKAEEREKQLRQELDVAGRLASIGEMASGIAHEINNPLTGVIGFAQLLMSRDIPDDVREDLKVINDEAQRVAKIVAGLLTFAHQHKPGRENVDINEIILEVLKLRSYEMQVNNIKVVPQFAPGLPQTTADGNQLQQVFLNIILNAEQAMVKAHGGGNLSIKTERVEDSIWVSLADDGPGISKENLDKIFNPFFTTRGVGQGTGLGLSICHGIITQHKGKIYAQSELGKGATFIVELPIVVATDDTEKKGKPKVMEEETPKREGAKVLVVDDEKAILILLNRLLAEWGYEVETVDNANDALDRLSNEKYSLILLDIKLPGMSGTELYRHIEATDPALTRRVMFVTGDVMETTTRNFLEKTNALYIAKPVNIEQLKSNINHILTRGELVTQH
jgi:PAS domain S-box-containing protein